MAFEKKMLGVMSRPELGELIPPQRGEGRLYNFCPGWSGVKYGFVSLLSKGPGRGPISEVLIGSINSPLAIQLPPEVRAKWIIEFHRALDHNKVDWPNQNMTKQTMPRAIYLAKVSPGKVQNAQKFLQHPLSIYCWIGICFVAIEACCWGTQAGITRL